MARRAARVKIPSGEAKVEEQEAIMLRALFERRDRILHEAQQEIAKVEETIREIAGNVAARAKWPRVAPGGVYSFNPALGGKELVMRFIAIPEKGAGKEKGDGGTAADTA